MWSDCSTAHNQLQKWNSIRSEWDDAKTNEVENECIEPLESILSTMNEKLYEIHDFINETETRVQEITEGN